MQPWTEFGPSIQMGSLAPVVSTAQKWMRYTMNQCVAPGVNFRDRGLALGADTEPGATMQIFLRE